MQLSYGRTSSIEQWKSEFKNYALTQFFLGAPHSTKMSTDSTSPLPSILGL